MNSKLSSNRKLEPSLEHSIAAPKLNKLQPPKLGKLQPAKLTNSKHIPLGELEYGYQIYPPTIANRKFRLIKIFKGTGKSETVHSAEMVRINSGLLDGSLTKLEARAQIEQLRTTLYERDGVSVARNETSVENLKILEVYWSREIKPGLKLLADPKSARHELDRAIAAAGTVNLRLCTERELQRQVDKLAGNKQRRVTNKLNSILRFLNRDFTIKLAELEKPEIKFITLAELPKLIGQIENSDIRLLHEVCFYTGCLVGEAFALDARTYVRPRDVIKISAQIDKEGSKRETRNGKERRAIVIREGETALLAWFKIRDSFPQEVRRHISRYTRKASMLAFDSPAKHITFHDLRHSYVVHLLSLCVPLHAVADSVGISYREAELYYGKYV